MVITESSHLAENIWGTIGICQCHIEEEQRFSHLSCVKWMSLKSTCISRSVQPFCKKETLPPFNKEDTFTCDPVCMYFDLRLEETLTGDCWYIQGSTVGDATSAFSPGYFFSWNRCLPCSFFLFSLSLLSSIVSLGFIWILSYFCALVKFPWSGQRASKKHPSQFLRSTLCSCP